MGADIDNIYHNRSLKGFAYLHNIISDCNDIFEARKIAFTKILQHITGTDFDLCSILTSFMPYINENMIQKMSHQKGMSLTQSAKKTKEYARIMW